jgi:hypothetical protein
MHREMLELYSDYLLVSFGPTSATGLSKLTGGEVSHDQVTRFLRQEESLSQNLWKLAKSLVRKIQHSEGVLIVDDTFIPKPYSKTNGFVEWHYNGATAKVEIGINIITVYYRGDESLEVNGVPVACEAVHKKSVWNEKKGKEEMKSVKTKNEYCRELLRVCKQNDIKFKYVLMDSWYSGCDNMNFIVEDLEKSFIVSLKGNRTVAKKDSDGNITWIGEIQNLRWGNAEVEEVYVGGVDFPVYVTRIIFTNEDKSTGTLYLCSDDQDLTKDKMLKTYQRRWGVEEFHKSAKQNASLGKSSASVRGSQITHILCVMYGYIKLEWMRIGSGLNHFAIRSRLYLAALRGSSRELEKMRKSINYTPPEIA